MKQCLKFISLLLVIFLNLSLFSGCGDNTSDAYIYFELPKVPETLDPQTAREDSELLIINNIYEGLMRLDKDGNPVCGAAESYTVSGLKYTFKLRKDAVWSNGEPLTADDFVFALRRAVNPKTKAPFASRLSSIKNAASIIKGKKSPQKLGVRATDEKTLVITLAKKDKEFLKTLSTSVAMPCNQKLFEESAGKFGLFKDYIISNGSYKLTKWNKESFGIRLYRNKDYNGDFNAKNAAVFLTCREDKDVIEQLKKNNIDMAFVESSFSKSLENDGIETINFQNICWVLTINDDFSYNMRNALRMLIGKDIYSSNLPIGYQAANSIFPQTLTSTPPADGISIYNLNSGKKLFKEEVGKLKDKKFPSDIILYYYDNGTSKSLVTDIVGHWQSNLSAFINIESVSESDLLLPELKRQKLSMAIFPVRADSTRIDEYLEKFGFKYSGQSLGKIQSSILDNSNVIPLAFQNTCIAHSKSLTEISCIPGNGYIDFSFIVKKE